MATSPHAQHNEVLQNIFARSPRSPSSRQPTTPGARPPDSHTASSSEQWMFAHWNIKEVALWLETLGPAFTQIIELNLDGTALVQLLKDARPDALLSMIGVNRVLQTEFLAQLRRLSQSNGPKPSPTKSTSRTRPDGMILAPSAVPKEMIRTQSSLLSDPLVSSTHGDSGQLDGFLEAVKLRQRSIVLGSVSTSESSIGSKSSSRRVSVSESSTNSLAEFMHSAPASITSVVTEFVAPNEIYAESTASPRAVPPLAMEGDPLLRWFATFCGTDQEQLERFYLSPARLQSGGFRVMRHEPIGQGGFGHVYACTLDHMNYAVKMSKRCEVASKLVGNDRDPLPAIQQPARLQETLRCFAQDLAGLTLVSYPGLVKVIGFSLDVVEECGQLHLETLLIMQRMKHSLADLFHDRPGGVRQPLQLMPFEKFRVLLEVAVILQYLHELPIGALVHGDISPGNILLDDHLRVKLGDFGFSHHLGSRSTTVHGMTRGFGDPAKEASPRVIGTCNDVYSFGMVALYMYGGPLTSPNGPVLPVSGSAVGPGPASHRHYWKPPRHPASIDRDRFRHLPKPLRRLVSSCLDEVSRRPRMGEVVDAMTNLCSLMLLFDNRYSMQFQRDFDTLKARLEDSRQTISNDILRAGWKIVSPTQSTTLGGSPDRVGLTSQERRTYVAWYTNKEAQLLPQLHIREQRWKLFDRVEVKVAGPMLGKILLGQLELLREASLRSQPDAEDSVAAQLFSSIEVKWRALAELASSVPATGTYLVIQLQLKLKKFTFPCRNRMLCQLDEISSDLHSQQNRPVSLGLLFDAFSLTQSAAAAGFNSPAHESVPFSNQQIANHKASQTSNASSVPLSPALISLHSGIFFVIGLVDDSDIEPRTDRARVAFLTEPIGFKADAGTVTPGLLLHSHSRPEAPPSAQLPATQSQPDATLPASANLCSAVLSPAAPSPQAGAPQVATSSQLYIATTLHGYVADYLRDPLEFSRRLITRKKQTNGYNGVYIIDTKSSATDIARAWLAGVRYKNRNAAYAKVVMPIPLKAGWGRYKSGDEKRVGYAGEVIYDIRRGVSGPGDVALDFALIRYGSPPACSHDHGNCPDLDKAESERIYQGLTDEEWDDINTETATLSLRVLEFQDHFQLGKKAIQRLIFDIYTWKSIVPAWSYGPTPERADFAPWGGGAHWVLTTNQVLIEDGWSGSLVRRRSDSLIVGYIVAGSCKNADGTLPVPCKAVMAIFSKVHKEMLQLEQAADRPANVELYPKLRLCSRNQLPQCNLMHLSLKSSWVLSNSDDGFSWSSQTE